MLVIKPLWRFCCDESCISLLQLCSFNMQLVSLLLAGTGTSTLAAVVRDVEHCAC